MAEAKPWRLASRRHARSIMHTFILWQCLAFGVVCILVIVGFFRKSGSL